GIWLTGPRTRPSRSASPGWPCARRPATGPDRVRRGAYVEHHIDQPTFRGSPRRHLGGKVGDALGGEYRGLAVEIGPPGRRRWQGSARSGAGLWDSNVSGVGVRAPFMTVSASVVCLANRAVLGAESFSLIRRKPRPRRRR